jgi:hypothetical protein
VAASGCVGDAAGLVALAHKRAAAHSWRRRADCCAELSSAGLYQDQTTAQGVCALPDDQFTCYVPDRQTRSCRREEVDIASGGPPAC